MADRGLQEAIHAAGGVTELARRIGISQPSVSNWTRVPAGRVLAIESATGVDRTVLRPDLYTHVGTATGTGDTFIARGRVPDDARTAMRIIGLAGWSGSGKTTLVTKLIPCLLARGIRVSTLKHAHHGFDLDTPGKDSFMHRAAGATEVIISSGRRWAMLHELRGEPEWDLANLVAKMSPVDLVLVEGFKRDAFPKLEIHRVVNGKPLLHPDDPHIVAVASDDPVPAAQVPVIDLNDIDAVADLVLQHAVAIGNVARVE